tara:strand:+ start:616 stop:795 length:180 start_codon:yes stop_codon:yes gene_type:complete
MFLTDPLKFFVFLVGIGMLMTVFQCDGTMNRNISEEILEVCKTGEYHLGIYKECKEAGY